MARRAPPGDRLAVEAVLAQTPIPGGSNLLDALDALGRLIGVEEPELWQSHQGLAVVFEAAAAAAMVNALRADGASEGEALQVAAARLGVDPRTLAARLRHRRREADIDAA